jgi:hypothetical protein
MSSTHHQLAEALLSGGADVPVLAGQERLGVVTFVTEGVAKSRDTETFRLVLYADPKMRAVDFSARNFSSPARSSDHLYNALRCQA